MEAVLLESIKIFNEYRVFCLSVMLMLVVGMLIREGLRDAQEEIDE